MESAKSRDDMSRSETFRDSEEDRERRWDELPGKETIGMVSETVREGLEMSNKRRSTRGMVRKGPGGVENSIKQEEHTRMLGKQWVDK